MVSLVNSFVLLGAGGHAKVLFSMARLLNLNIVAVSNPALKSRNIATWNEIKVIDDEELLLNYRPEKVSLINGIGQVVGNDKRRAVFEFYQQRKFKFPKLVHPFAVVDLNVEMEDGVQVMAGSIVQAGTTIGRNSIINTRAVVDHDCKLASNVHIAPGAVVCGNVVIEDGAFVGAGATIANGIKIGKNAIAGAGVSIVRDTIDESVIIPAKTRKK